jgi:hypothetical protein
VYLINPIFLKGTEQEVSLARFNKLGQTPRLASPLPIRHHLDTFAVHFRPANIAGALDSPPKNPERMVRRHDDNRSVDCLHRVTPGGLEKGLVAFHVVIIGQTINKVNRRYKKY